ncbi:MAG: carbamoyltransferase HypF [Leptolyngbyaceae cyanobacterium]
MKEAHFGAVGETMRVQGTVQGVGFRPTVYRLATACALKGEVLNDGEGVLIRAIGPQPSLDRFVQLLQANCPPLAKIDQILRTPLGDLPPYQDFQIVQSCSTTVQTNITADAATCPDCIQDTFDPRSRWYHYPFTNCTHCGPRLSIIRAIPYDRRHTSMATFPLCEACALVYRDVNDRRFHAQPVACLRCGPHAWLERADGQAIAAHPFSSIEAVEAAGTLLQQGKIIAIKGIGGIHLACDATNEIAVQTLRQRKRRSDKPFALMARDLEVIQHYCQVSGAERALLQSAAAPIVLLKLSRQAAAPPGRLDSPLLGTLDPSLPQTGKPPIALAVAPGLSALGFMLPYTALHHLLLRSMERPIVLTSGNLSDEPQCIDNHEARQKLGAIADYFLLHNRDIVNRIDDSIVRVVQGQAQVLRRARGYAPTPLPLPRGFEQAPPVLAMGSELKNTLCLVQQGRAIVSQHLGDLEHATAFAAYQETLGRYTDLFQHQPEVVAVDRHPDYLSTKLGQTLAEAQSLPLQIIQHHHAHVAACMADNGLPLDSSPVLGIALDGLGWGEDGTLWGGEFLLADYRQFRRLARLQPVALLGGSQAMRQPWRNTYAHLMTAFTWEGLQAQYGSLPLVQWLEQQPRSLLNQMAQKGIHSPLASSAGRLFDAVAWAIGLSPEQVSYEGQAAIQLEAAIHPQDLASEAVYPLQWQPIQVDGAEVLQLDTKAMWAALLNDLLESQEAGLISAKFHLGLARAIAQVVHQLNQHHSFTQVALTGGVFQNEVLACAVQHHLTAMNYPVLTHHLVPPNDGGLSLGQGAIAAARALSHPLG